MNGIGGASSPITTGGAAQPAAVTTPQAQPAATPAAATPAQAPVTGYSTQDSGPVHTPTTPAASATPQMVSAGLHGRAFKDLQMPDKPMSQMSTAELTTLKDQLGKDMHHAKHEHNFMGRIGRGFRHEMKAAKELMGKIDTQLAANAATPAAAPAATTPAAGTKPSATG